MESLHLASGAAFGSHSWPTSYIQHTLDWSHMQILGHEVPIPAGLGPTLHTAPTLAEPGPMLYVTPTLDFPGKVLLSAWVLGCLKWVLHVLDFVCCGWGGVYGLDLHHFSGLRGQISLTPPVINLPKAHVIVFQDQVGSPNQLRDGDRARYLCQVGNIHSLQLSSVFLY